MNITQALVESALKKFIDPYLNTDWVSAGMLSKIDISANQVSVTLDLGYPFVNEQLFENAQLFLKQTLTVPVDIKATWHIASQSSRLTPNPDIKNIIAVASGKGGVGKSTVAVNLALALSGLGATVGLLDADIYGPSIPMMLGLQEKPQSVDGKRMLPLKKFGLQLMSMGLLVDPNAAMVWRGPMVSMALQQLLNDTHWQKLDYLIIDLPPGTGDIQLTLAQKIPVSGSVIVTTPQMISLLDARRAIEMFKKVRIPVLGIVENMSTYHCPHCNEAAAIFGEGGGQQIAHEYQTRLLGQLPLALSTRAQMDNGQPPVIAEPTGVVASLYQTIALRTAATLALQTKKTTTKFPKITIE